jgi:hypothetical protein
LEYFSWDTLFVVTRLVTSDIDAIPRVCKGISDRRKKNVNGIINCTAAARERELSEFT